MVGFQHDRHVVGQAETNDFHYFVLWGKHQLLHVLFTGMHHGSMHQPSACFTAHHAAGFMEAVHAAQILANAGHAHKGAFPLMTLQQAFLGQLMQRLAHGDTADPVGGAKLLLGWNAAMHGVDAGGNVAAQFLNQLLVQGAVAFGIQNLLVFHMRHLCIVCL